MVKDKEHRFVACNSQFLKMSGFSSVEDILGLTDFDMPWKEYSEIYQAHERDILSGSQYDLFEPIIDSKGKKHNLHIRKKIIEDSKGEIAGIIAHAMIFEYRYEMEMIKFSTNCFTISHGNNIEDLSKKEKEVAFLFLNGYKRQEASKYLSISPRTFDSHIVSIKNKLNCDSSHDLIIKGFQLGLKDKIPETILKEGGFHKPNNE
ncbi:LuxR C-terminal-related transcriptional regulator [Vibrio sp. Isolate23]|uniref:LuxR C-terminal-related transcriptional regulator n=1 Tax=Vibrio TaxID=662 RepID=UPI001EFE2A47|nr:MULTISPECIES: LuxR C-terminal-related transcriptional regulator [Vibrio]MCG9681552.1 LuxR C-terminal-related transcriptional regulator [Vibrio sp. Isolate23]USD34641.1 hypothetical protein J8Z27_21720 [Vibrio sp. SCSIO 43186]USD47708.1 hypothetical protein J4N38_22115 [Vibrio sp. SCSIO 43145]USD71766.1 hypothetical protein J4N41_21735 [Vibrio sp. SCSIO 43139]USD98669.1 hypothetical protein CTT30_21925 [Vibrio coralliilyticus]